MAFLKQFGDCEGPLGLPMRSESAKELESLLTTIDPECRKLGLQRMSKVPASFSLEEGERADISLVTCDTLDADREIVMPTGLDWSRFKKAGMPVTWCHNYNELPVGRAAWVKRQKQGDVDGWLAKTLYADKPDNFTGEWFADAVWHMVKSKIIRGKSIGYIPTKMRAPTTKEAEDNDGLRWVFETCVILEYAVTPIQSNPDAVVQEVAKCMKKGMNIPDKILEDMGLIVPSDLPPVVKSADLPLLPENPKVPELKNFLTLEQWSASVHHGVQEKIKGIDLSKLFQDQFELSLGRV